MRFLRLMRSKLFFFKRLRIGITLIGGAFKAVTFNHFEYFIFCIILTLTQILRIKALTIIDPQTSFSILITESLAGQNFFEIMIDYLKEPLFFYDFYIMFMKSGLFLLELYIFLFISASVSYYTKMKIDRVDASVKKSIFLSLKRSKAILIWALFEILIALLVALLGFLGDLVQIVWQLVTVLSIQVIAFQSKSAINTLKNSINLFKRAFGNIVGIDVFIDIILGLLTAIFYYIYRTQVVPTFGFLANGYNTSFIIFIIIFYLISLVFVAQAIALTGLYRTLYNKKVLKSVVERENIFTKSQK